MRINYILPLHIEFPLTNKSPPFHSLSPLHNTHFPAVRTVDVHSAVRLYSAEAVACLTAVFSAIDVLGREKDQACHPARLIERDANL